MRTHHLLGALALLSTPALSQATFIELATIDLDSTANAANPEYVGTNPSAVAWDGTDLWIAGFNGSGSAAGVAILPISDALTTATFGATFGAQTAPALRGYSGLDVGAGGVAAAYDPGGTDPSGITFWSGGTSWARSARGGSGVGVDPGFPGGDPAMGAGVAWTTFGSGRRALQDAATGVDIWDTTNGMIILTPEGAFWRDMDFDDATGDIWLREGNNVISWERTGDNAVSNSAVVFDPMDADFVNGQNIAYMDSGAGDLVIFNDRASSSGGQDFFAVVNLILPDGTPVPNNWGNFSPAPGAGYYDFSWDAASETLAVLDFSNRNVHIFEVTQSVSGPFCTSLPNSTGMTASLSLSGSSVVANNDLTMTASQLPSNEFGYFLASETPGMVVGPGGSSGVLCVAGNIARLVNTLGSSGPAGELTGMMDLTNVPTNPPTSVMAGETWYFQCWFRDGNTSNFSDGAEATFQ